MKECRKCGNRKDKDEFGKDIQKKDGLNFYCKSCIKKRSAQQRENDPEYSKSYANKYREANRQLLRKKAWLNYYINWEKRSEQAKKSYHKHREKIAKKRAEKRRTEEQKEKNRLRMADWRKLNRSKVGEIVVKWKKENPKKSNAHSLVVWAVKTGVLKRSENCEECKKNCKTEGHHLDYDKPLEVIWLCKSCHSKKHQKYR
jgi:hypothetical protein